MARPVNLARRPFVNERPVRRTALALWVAAAAFLLADGWLFGSYLRGRADQRGELASLSERIAEEQRAVAGLERDLAGVDLAQQNQRVAFLNHKIAERTFSWSVLFDRITAVLPEDVRLLSLVPRIEGPDRRKRRPAQDGPRRERVSLSLDASARREEAVLELLDALYADAAFIDPNLARESRDQGELRFSLTAVYLPDVAEGRAEPAAEASR